MTKAEILKREILRQYRSIRQFALELNIPYSTLVTALERGIEGMAYGTVIKMCDKLRSDASGKPGDAVLYEIKPGRPGQGPGSDGRFFTNRKISGKGEEN